MQTSCPVDFHAIKGVSPVPPPSKVNHSTSWAGATVCEWQLVQLDPLGAKNTADNGELTSSRFGATSTGLANPSWSRRGG